MNQHQIVQELEQIPELRNRLNSPDLTLIVSVSGGADSIASLLHCIAAYPNANIQAFHAALPMDWITTIPYLREVTAKFNIPLHIKQAIYQKYLRQYKNGRPSEPSLKMKLVDIGIDRNIPFDKESAALHLNQQPENLITGVLDLADYRKAPPTSRIRFCTAYMKRAPFDKWVRENREELGAAAVNVMGYRRLESSGRAKQPVGRIRDSLTLVSSGWTIYDYHPILHWTKDKAFAILQKHGIEPHIAYKAQGLDLSKKIPEGGPRMSCVGCIFASPQHIANAVRYSDEIPPYETTHARNVVHRILKFQCSSGMSWQQSGEIGLNRAAEILGEPPFRKAAGVPSYISLKF